MNQRIKPLDGLRAIAALGVVWVHVWAFYGIPVLKFAKIDVYQLVSVVGNGVDFFFVISGFCMYLMAWNNSFSWKYYQVFLMKRFRRIAPAYYVSLLVYTLLILWQDTGFDFITPVIIHLLFLNNVIGGNVISAPFWSIGTEWHFYLILPFVLLIAQKFSVVKAMFLLTSLSIILFCIVNLGYLSFNWWEKQIFIRFPEFTVGIVAAWHFKRSARLPVFMRGLSGIFLSLTLIYIGRIMKFTGLVEALPQIGFVIKSLSLFILSIGFGFLLYHVVTEESWLSKFLSKKSVTYLGKISFSIYLWHSLVILILTAVLNNLNFGSYNLMVGFLLVSILTIIIATISYRYLEAFYFRKRS